MTEKAKELLDKFDHNLNGVLFDLVDENETLEGQVNELTEQVARLTEKQNRKTIDVKLGGEVIYRQAVLATLDNMDKALDEERTVEKYKELLAECVKALPPAEDKGEWIHPYRSDIACECSVCHMQMPITDYFHYCPNCGADMRGDT